MSPKVGDIVSYTEYVNGHAVIRQFKITSVREIPQPDGGKVTVIDAIPA